MVECFNHLSQHSDTRCVVISGRGKAFTAGLDLIDNAGQMASIEDETGRRAFFLRNAIIKPYQEAFTVIEKVHVTPYLLCMHIPYYLD